MTILQEQVIDAPPAAPDFGAVAEEESFDQFMDRLATSEKGDLKEGDLEVFMKFIRQAQKKAPEDIAGFARKVNDALKKQSLALRKRGNQIFKLTYKTKEGEPILLRLRRVGQGSSQGFKQAGRLRVVPIQWSSKKHRMVPAPGLAA